MTVDDRLTIEPSDVLAVEIGCIKCGTTIVTTPERAMRMLSNGVACQSCGAGLIRERSDDAETVNALAYGLSELSQKPAKGAPQPPFRVRLQIVNPKRVG